MTLTSTKQELPENGIELEEGMLTKTSIGNIVLITAITDSQITGIVLYSNGIIKLGRTLRGFEHKELVPYFGSITLTQQ